MQIKTIIRAGAFSGATAVALGAFGAHGLQSMVEKGSLTDHDLSIYETAVRYQMYHTFALLAAAALQQWLSPKSQHRSALLFIFGMIIFSGSLYLLALSPVIFGSQVSWLGAITPLGGVAFIAGWLTLFFGAATKN